MPFYLFLFIIYTVPMAKCFTRVKGHLIRAIHAHVNDYCLSNFVALGLSCVNTYLFYQQPTSMAYINMHVVASLHNGFS